MTIEEALLIFEKQEETLNQFQEELRDVKVCLLLNTFSNQETSQLEKLKFLFEEIIFELEKVPSEIDKVKCQELYNQMMNLKSEINQ